MESARSSITWMKSCSEFENEDIPNDVTRRNTDHVPGRLVCRRSPSSKIRGWQAQISEGRCRSCWIRGYWFLRIWYRKGCVIHCKRVWWLFCTHAQHVVKILGVCFNGIFFMLQICFDHICCTHSVSCCVCRVTFFNIL
jgi:hypothetical protein